MKHIFARHRAGTLAAVGFAPFVLASCLDLHGARVAVDFATPAGAVKPMHAVGQPPLLGHDNTSLFHYLKEAGVPYSRLHDVGGAFARGVLVDIPNIFRNFDADENDPANYDFAFTDILIGELIRNGVEPYFRLGVTIENSRKVRAYRIHPPKDFAKWARICEHIIRHYTEGWANGFRHRITYWEIWNEPENQDDPGKNQMWTGTWGEYCRLYETAAKHLKEKFPKLKIGGYGSCGFYAAVPGKDLSPRKVYMVDCYTNFLAYVRRTKTPLDFFSFHAYSKPRDAVNQTKWAIDTLRSYGFNDTETSLNEWHPGGGQDKLGTAEQAAEICAEMVGLQATELDNAMLYDARCGLGVYSPLFNPLTFRPHKAYYALRAFNELYRLKNAVKSVSDDPDVWTLAAARDKSAKLLVVNASAAEKPLALDLQGRTVVSATVTDETRTEGKLASFGTIPPHAIVVYTLSDRDPASDAIVGRRIAYPPRVTAWPQLKGVMLPARNMTEDDFKTLKAWGVTLGRYQMIQSLWAWKGQGIDPDRDVEKVVALYDKWLDGKLDHLEKFVLPMAKKYGLKICVDLHEAPGNRYIPRCGAVPRGRNLAFRMYYTEAYRKCFYDSWRKIATRFKGDPAIYGYDLINEPVQTAATPVGYWEIQNEAAHIVRSIDPDTPIVIEGYFMDNPNSFQTLRPLDLDNVIYQVHMYMPFLFTHQFVGIDQDWKIRAAYPDAARGWDKIYLRECLKYVRAFEKRHGARIYVGEFGAVAWAKGADAFIRDCTELFNEYGWDWSHHAFRESNNWSVEYECDNPLAAKPVPSADNPRMRALKAGLTGKSVPELCHYDQLENGILALFHFGPNAFTDLEWGFGDTPASVFNPQKFDADQWVDAVIPAGVRRLVVVAKHHDGFCLWPSKLNDSYTVANSPWKGGRGDLVREVQQACLRKGVKFGVYLSPWDRNRADFARESYPAYYRGQMDELLANYGPIYEVWLDGCMMGEGWYGGAKERRKIDGKLWTYYGMESVIEKMHARYPRAIAFNGQGAYSGASVGNERGVMQETPWGVNLTGGFVPYECDVALRPGWFWHPREQPKSLAHLVEIYFSSVGRGAVLDLGIAPNRDGVVGADDVQRLKEFGDWVREFNAVDFAAGAKTVRAAKSIEMVLPRPQKVNCFDLREDLYRGWQIKSWKGEARVNGAWKTVATGEMVGFRRLVRFDEVTADAFRVTITSDRGAWAGCALRRARKVMASGQKVDLGIDLISRHYGNCIDRKAPPDEWIWRFKKPVKLDTLLFRAFWNNQVFVDRYAVYGSDDGVNWTLVKEGEFGNVKANPIAYWVNLGKVMSFRNLKFKAVHAVDDVPPVWNRKNTSAVCFGLRDIRQ